ncbi:Uncharacterised protein [uncultured archaeon]|nr:Uncharacterised protein [uncultured archaeon]
MIFLAMDFVYRKMKSDRERKLLVIDEAWSLLGLGEGASRIFGIIKTARKFGLAVAIITQEAEDLVSTPAGRTILANTSWKFLCRQEPAAIEDLSKKFRLNAEEKSILLTAMPGEGLLFALNDHIPLRVVPSPKEYELVTTNPEEMKKIMEKEKAEMEMARAGDMKMGGDWHPAEKIMPLSAEQEATLRLAAAEIRGYTDSLKTGECSGIGIVFHGSEKNSSEGMGYFGVVAPGNGNSFEEIIGREEIKNFVAQENMKKVFVILESKLPEGKNAGQGFGGKCCFVTHEEFREKLREIFT